jgi:hypothetical protein
VDATHDWIDNLAMNHPFFLAGSWEQSSHPLPVTCPYDNSIIATTWLAGDE